MAAQPDKTHTFAEGEVLLFSISNSSWNCQLGKFSPVSTLAPSPSKENPFFSSSGVSGVKAMLLFKRQKHLSFHENVSLSAGLTVSSLD